MVIGVVVVMDGLSAGSARGGETRPWCRCRRRGRDDGRQNPGRPWGRPATILRIPVLADTAVGQSDPSCRIEVPVNCHCVTARRRKDVRSSERVAPMHWPTFHSLASPSFPPFQVATALVMLRSPSRVVAPRPFELVQTHDSHPVSSQCPGTAAVINRLLHVDMAYRQCGS